MASLLSCENCVQKSLAIALLAGRIEYQRHRQKLRQILALEAEMLIAAVAKPEAQRELRQQIKEQAAYVRNDCLAKGITAVCQHSELFPAALCELSDLPAVLYHMGAVPLNKLAEGYSTAIAIVGARQATSYGAEVARKLATQLVQANLLVVSGMALGIDCAAHNGALIAGGQTLAVLASGVDIAYPASKRRLYQQILGQGAVVSELPPGFRPYKWCFPARNRLIAALSVMTVVVEASERSGSLITADFAAQAGKAVAAVPGPVNSSRSLGTNTLLFDGAYVVRDGQDIVDALFGAGSINVDQFSTQQTGQLAQELRTLLEEMSPQGETASSLQQKLPNRPISLLATQLAELEVYGYLRRDFQGRYLK